MGVTPDTTLYDFEIYSLYHLHCILLFVSFLSIQWIPFVDCSWTTCECVRYVLSWIWPTFNFCSSHQILSQSPRVWVRVRVRARFESGTCSHMINQLTRRGNTLWIQINCKLWLNFTHNRISIKYWMFHASLMIHFHWMMNIMVEWLFTKAGIVFDSVFVLNLWYMLGISRMWVICVIWLNVEGMVEWLD